MFALLARGEGRTYAKVGELMGVSGSRARQLVRDGLAELRVTS